MRIRLPSREVKVQSRKSKAITKADLPTLRGHEVQKMLEGPHREIKEGFRKGSNHQPRRLLKSGKVTLCKIGQAMKRNTLMAHHQREPIGFLSSLNGSDGDKTGEEEGKEEREPRLEGIVEDGAKEGSGGEHEHGTEDAKRYKDMPDCFSHEFLCKPSKCSSIGAVLVDLMGVKAD
eukprot:jgi/Tetstr1/456170/TSEL_042938.t1